MYESYRVSLETENGAHFLISMYRDGIKKATFLMLNGSQTVSIDAMVAQRGFPARFCTNVSERHSQPSLMSVQNIARNPSLDDQCRSKLSGIHYQKNSPFYAHHGISSKTAPTASSDVMWSQNGVCKSFHQMSSERLENIKDTTEFGNTVSKIVCTNSET